jgi:hypothetical protein
MVRHAVEAVRLWPVLAQGSQNHEGVRSAFGKWQPASWKFRTRTAVVIDNFAIEMPVTFRRTAISLSLFLFKHDLFGSEAAAAAGIPV